METETEMASFPFPDHHSSTWLQSDSVYTPAFPEDQFPDFSADLDNTHFDATEFGGHPFFSLHSPAHHHNIDESFLLDLCCSLPMAQVGPLANEEDSCKQLTHDDFLDVVASLESDQSFVEQVLASSPMSTTNMMTNSPETGLEMEGMASGSQDREDDEEEEEEEEEDETGTDPPKPNTNAGLNCKNLYSERNRRKRLSQQLLALRALVPNITKMDKRSVLVDALAYVKSIQEETARIESELKERRPSSPQEGNSGSNLPPKRNLTSKKAKAQILEIDAERIEDRRFVVKITCKGGPGVGGEVLRVMESLGFEITYVALEQIRPLHTLTTLFIRVRRQARLTEEKLKESITNMALRTGLTLQKSLS